VKHLCEQNVDNPVSGIARSGWQSGLQFLVKYLIESMGKSPKSAYNFCCAPFTRRFCPFCSV